MAEQDGGAAVLVERRRNRSRVCFVLDKIAGGDFFLKKKRGQGFKSRKSPCKIQGHALASPQVLEIWQKPPLPP